MRTSIKAGIAIAVVLVIAILSWGHVSRLACKIAPMCYGLYTSDLQTQLPGEIQAQLDGNPLLHALDPHVKTVEVVHETQNRYRGMASIEVGNQTQNLPVSIAYDGDKIDWQISQADLAKFAFEGAAAKLSR